MQATNKMENEERLFKEKNERYLKMENDLKTQSLFILYIVS